MMILEISQKARDDIAKVIAHATANEVSMGELMVRASNPSRLPAHGDDERHVCHIPDGFRCVFTIDEQMPPLGRCRHLSVSVSGARKTPPVAAVMMLMHQFGFVGGLDDLDFLYIEGKDQPCFIDGEPRIAINVIQKLVAEKKGTS